MTGNIKNPHPKTSDPKAESHDVDQNRMTPDGWYNCPSTYKVTNNLNRELANRHIVKKTMISYVE
jgi:hypothetical protein